MGMIIPLEGSRLFYVVESVRVFDVLGDFFQLPPVGLGRNGVQFCFESRWWNIVVEV